MTSEQLEQKIKELEAKQSNPSPSLTLEIPEEFQELSPALQKIWKQMQSQNQELREKISNLEAAPAKKEAETKEQAFAKAEADFKAAHPELFEEKNKAYLSVMNSLLGPELNSVTGTDFLPAMESALEQLKTVSNFTTEDSGEKKTEEKKELSTGSKLASTFSTKSSDDLTKPKIESAKDAVTEAFKEVSADGADLSIFDT